jgi:hypothetical protein
VFDCLFFGLQILCFLLQVDVACRAFHQETLDDDDGGDGDDTSTEGEDGVSPKEVQLFTYTVIM